MHIFIYIYMLIYAYICVCECVHVYVYIYVYIYTHLHTYTYIHTYIYTYIYIRMTHAHTHVHTRTCVHTQHTHTTQTHTHTHTRPFGCAHQQLGGYIYVHTHIYPYIHRHIHTYNHDAHVHTHTHTYTHTHTLIWPQLPTAGSGYFSRTRLKCSFTVVKTLLFCTRKWSCNLSCTSALSLLQLPCKGPTGQVPLPEHEISHGTCTRCSFRKFCVPGGGPDQLNRCKEGAAGSMLTCSSNCSFISWYKTMGFLPPWSCTWVAFWKNSHWEVVYIGINTNAWYVNTYIRTYIHSWRVHTHTRPHKHTQTLGHARQRRGGYMYIHENTYIQVCTYI